jgi:acylphosphatase
MIEMQCTVSGKVQRVGYRDYVEQAAKELGLVGQVQNNPDGTVFVLAQGEPESLLQLVEYLHEGSVLAQVSGVSVEWGTAKESYDEFSVTA